MNNAYLSLEQEFALRFLSIQIRYNTNVPNLQNKLINLFEQVLIKHQKLQDIYSSSRQQNEKTSLPSKNIKTFVSGLEAEATLFYSCIDSIKNINNTGQLQSLLIEAIEISMMQKNYSDFISVRGNPPSSAKQVGDESELKSVVS